MLYDKRERGSGPGDDPPKWKWTWTGAFAYLGFAALVATIVLAGFYFLAYGKIPDSGMWTLIALAICIGSFILSAVTDFYFDEDPNRP